MKRLMSVMLLGAAVNAGCSGDATSDMEQDVIGPSHACDTTQVFGRSDHQGAPACAPLTKLSVVDQTVIDSSFNDELFNNGMFVHYMQPLTNGAFKYEEIKTGFTDFDHQGTQTWSVQAKQHIGAANVVAWTFPSTWRPLDAINPLSWTNGFEQMFQPVLTTQGLYVPQAAGQVAIVNATTGALVRTIDPLAGTAFSGDPLVLVNSGLSADRIGNVYYTVVAWPTGGAAGVVQRGSWLVRISATGGVTLTPWSQIATAQVGVVQANDLCPLQFRLFDPSFSTGPFPSPNPDSLAPTGHCGAPFPPVNAAPAIATDGSVVVLSQGNNASRSRYVIKLSPAISPIWASELIDIAQDGCGINIPFDNADKFACRVGAKLGVDPQYDLFPTDVQGGIEQVAPVIAPNGTIYVSTYSGGYDNNNGHMTHFSSAGKFLGSFPFAFFAVPTIQRTGTGDSDFRLVMDTNQFSPTTGDGEGNDGTYKTSVLDASLNALSTFIVKQDVTAFANDFVDGQAAIDTAGNSYHMDAQGTLYKLGPNSELLDSLHLADSTEPVPSEMSWGTDGAGRPFLLVTFGGVTYEIGTSTVGQPQPAVSTATTPKVMHSGRVPRPLDLR